MKVLLSLFALLVVTTSAGYTLSASCPVCCNIGQAPTNFDKTNALSQRCDGPKGTYVGCCNEVGHCCPAILGFPSKKYLCCDSAKKESCKNSYEPVCYAASLSQTASQLYCSTQRPNSRPGIFPLFFGLFACCSSILPCVFVLCCVGWRMAAELKKMESRNGGLVQNKICF